MLFKFFVLLSVVFLVCQADEHGTKHSKHIRLYECYQQLECVHKQKHDDAESIKSQTETYAHRPTEEDNACEREYHSVTSHHVGKETDHQSKGLGEHSKELDERHHRSGIGLEEQWYLGPEYLLPVLLVGKDVDGQHRAHRQEEGDVDVASNIGAAWEYGNQADEITGQDEEEHREQIRSIRFVVLLTYRRLDEVIMYRHHDHLHRSYKSLRSLALSIVVLIPACATQEYGYHNEHHNPYLQHTLGDAQIERANLLASHTLIYLAVMLLAEEELLGQTVSGAEEPLLSGIIARTTKDDGQRYADVMTLVAGYMPFVRVGQVLKHYLGDIELLVVVALASQCGHRQQRYHHQEDYRSKSFHYYLSIINSGEED